MTYRKDAEDARKNKIFLLENPLRTFGNCSMRYFTSCNPVVVRLCGEKPGPAGLSKAS
jgi:hypothetical protein